MPRRFRVHVAEFTTAPGAEVVIEGPDAHHVLRVLRLRAGEPLGVFDGRGTEWRGTIVSGVRGRVVLRLEAAETRPVEAACAITLFQGPCRGERLDWLVEKATEIGVARVVLFGPEDGPGERRVERLRRIAVEACKQCGRRQVPAVEFQAALPRAEAPALLLDPEAPTALLDACPEGTPARLWVGVGGQEGLAPADRDRARAEGWCPVGLGPRTLRAETAGLVAAAVLLHHFGDLGRGVKGPR